LAHSDSKQLAFFASFQLLFMPLLQWEGHSVLTLSVACQHWHRGGRVHSNAEME